MRDINVYLEPNSNGTFIYYPGHLLKGMVEYPLDHVEKIHCFSVAVIGKAKVNWEKQESSSTRSGDEVTIEYYKTLCWGEEISLNEETFFMGHKKGPLITLQPGVYKFTFECKLPLDLPYSLSAGLGEISYCVESNIDLENRYKICFGETPFTVVRYDDLNLYPELRSPFRHEKIKSFCFIFCTGSLIMTVSMPCTGFALGQSVPIKIEYLNNSNVDVKQTKVTLKLTKGFTILHPKTQTKEFDDIIASIVADGVKARQSNYFETILEVPQNLICSNERFCKIITVTYSINIEGEIGTFHSNPKIQIPVTIGNVQARPFM